MTGQKNDVQFWLCTFLVTVLTVILGVAPLAGAMRVDTLPEGSSQLNEYIHHFEGLDYDTDHLHNKHLRAKRSTSDPHVNFQFSAHGRDFELRLKKGSPVFHKECVLELSSGERVPCDSAPVYHGTVLGDPSSHVHGSIIGGRFAGEIDTSDGTYHVEKSEVYFRTPQKFHSVVYKDSDVDADPHRMRRSAEHGTCGSSHRRVHTWMQGVQNSAVEEPAGEVPLRKKRSASGSGHHSRVHQDNPYTMYSHTAQRREAEPEELTKRMCTLFLQSDTMLWKYYTDSGDDGLDYSPQEAREEITSLFANHVDGIKKIYMSTIFSNGESGNNALNYKGFMFQVQRIKINETDTDCPNGASTNNNQFCHPNIDVSNFLNLNSLMDHGDFCLAYVFTHRDFTGGTLGLAWVGAPSSSSGGICEQWKQYSENGRRVWKSLNTGIITLVNYGSRVPPKVSTLTLAHEVGHNFGSPHDSGLDCTPYSQSPPDGLGNYIMFASATSGDRKNNRLFSPCSVRNMTQVIHAVLSSNYGKTNCFTHSLEAFCGNKIVEDDEQCDCGYEDDCRNSQCCYPKSHPQECQLQKDASCSPSQGPCCTQDCQVVPAPDPNDPETETVCEKESECRSQAICDGLKPQCPMADPKENLTECNGKTQVCIEGECQGSICQKIGWLQCYLTDMGEGEGQYDKEQLCYVACAHPDSKKCISTGDLDASTKYAELKNLLGDVGMEAIKLPPGAPCDNFQGYCDVFQKCRGVDADGPLARLKDLLFSEETFNEIKDWIVKHWWGVLLMAVGVVILMGVFIKVCAVHTPSSNPKQPPARKLTLRRQPRHRTAAPPPGYPGPPRGGPPHGSRQAASTSSSQPHSSRSAPYQYEMHHKV